MRLPIPAKDFIHHYADCVGIVEHVKDGEKVSDIFIFNGFQSRNDGRNDVLTGSMITGKTNKKWGVAGFALKDVELSFPWPSLGVIDCTALSYNVTRVPKHHWKRGYCKASVSVDAICSVEAEMIGIPHNRDTALNPDLVYNLFNPKYNTPERAYELLDSGARMSAAIDPNIYLKISFVDDDILVCYKDCVIGTVKQSKQEGLVCKLIGGDEFLIDQIHNYFSFN